MRMKFKAIYYLLIWLLAVPSFVQAETINPNHNWAVLKVLQPGEKLFIKLKDNKKINGALKNVSDIRLVLFDGNQTINFNRQDILEIRLGHGRSLKKQILLGTLMGTGAGAALGGAAAATDDGYIDVKVSQGVPIGAAVGALFGTAVGAAVGLIRGQGQLIYKAPR